MHLRPALAADLPRLTAIAHRAKAHWGYPPSALHAWREDLRITADDLRRMTIVVAESQGEIAGFCAYAIGDAACALEHLWVRPASMGQGVGRTLLQHVLAAAASAGASRICVDADPHAEAFYVRHGAVRVGQIPAPIEGQPRRTRPQLELAVLRG